jgi:hypothetical protein
MEDRHSGLCRHRLSDMQQTFPAALFHVEQFRLHFRAPYPAVVGMTFYPSSVTLRAMLSLCARFSPPKPRRPHTTEC